MKIIDRLLGSDHQLSRPVFSKSPLVTLDFSGVKIDLRDPPHTAISPRVDIVDSLRLERTDNYEQQEEGHYAKLFYSRSWEMTGRRSRPVGGVSVTGIVLYFPDFPERDLSCFERRVFDNEILAFCHRAWGWQNEGAELGSLGDAHVIYPTTRAQLECRKINNASWCYFVAQVRGRPPQIEFALPITDEHILIFGFTLSAYSGIDFYSPETNIKETCFQIVDDFMSNVAITSPEAETARSTIMKR